MEIAINTTLLILFLVALAVVGTQIVSEVLLRKKINKLEVENEDLYNKVYNNRPNECAKIVFIIKQVIEYNEKRLEAKEKEKLRSLIENLVSTADLPESAAYIMPKTYAARRRRFMELTCDLSITSSIDISKIDEIIGLLKAIVD